MAVNKIYCDVCKKEIENDMHPKRLALREYVKINFERKGYKDCATYHICPECEQKLNKFIGVEQ